MKAIGYKNYKNKCKSILLYAVVHVQYRIFHLACEVLDYAYERIIKIGTEC